MGITMALSWNRWVAICRPFSATERLTIRRILTHVVLVIFGSSLFSAPRFWEITLNNGSLTVSRVVDNWIHNIIYRILSFSLFMYVVPIVYLTYNCITIIKTVKFSRIYYRNIKSMAVGHCTDLMQATRIAVAIFILTVVCNIPAFISHFVWSVSYLNDSFRHLDDYRPYLAIATNTVIAINSATNFIIYCVCSHSFRKHLKSN